LDNRQLTGLCGKNAGECGIKKRLKILFLGWRRDFAGWNGGSTGEFSSLTKDNSYVDNLPLV
jgi:hypothetical protein